MARTMQTRKRSRPQSGRPLKRRKTAFKKRRTNNFISSTRGIAGYVGFKKKRFNKKQYKRNLFISSLGKAHFRGSSSANISLDLPDSIVSKRVKFINMYSNAGGGFWTGANVSDTNGTAVGGTWLPEERLTIRGGLFELCIINNATTQIRAKLNRIWTTKSAVVTAFDDDIFGLSTSITEIPDWYKNFKLYGSWEVLIEPASSYIYKYKIPATQIVVGEANAAQNCPGIILEVSNLKGSATEDANYVSTFNVSFSADVITP